MGGRFWDLCRGKLLRVGPCEGEFLAAGNNALRFLGLSGLEGEWVRVWGIGSSPGVGFGAVPRL